METYLFYITHMVMVMCTVIIICLAWPQHKPVEMKRVEHMHSVISLHNKLKAIYRLFKAEGYDVKALIVSVLNIGMQITNQILK